jgi:hypothetical protein
MDNVITTDLILSISCSNLNKAGGIGGKMIVIMSLLHWYSCAQQSHVTSKLLPREVKCEEFNRCHEPAESNTRLCKSTDTPHHALNFGLSKFDITSNENSSFHGDYADSENEVLKGTIRWWTVKSSTLHCKNVKDKGIDLFGLSLCTMLFRKNSWSDV